MKQNNSSLSNKKQTYIPQDEDLPLFTEFAEPSPRPILITNRKAHIVYANHAWEKLTGYMISEVKGKDPKFLQSGKSSKVVYKKLWKSLKNGKSFITNEIVDKRKDGKEYQVRSVFYPIKRNNKIAYYVQTEHDITFQKTLDKQKDAFIAIASHELKTPVTSLYTYTQLFEKWLKQTNDKKGLNFIKKIMHQSIRLNNLIDDLLNVARINSGKLAIHKEEFSFNDLIKNVITDLNLTIHTHTIMQQGTLQNNVVADKDRIEQVLINLISNAVKYSPYANKVIVHITSDKQHAILGVQDFGYGIKKEDQSKIFGQFFRTQDKKKNNIQGFGLGLYITSEIIKKHKEKIWVESEIGKGSTFYFTLPLVR